MGKMAHLGIDAGFGEGWCHLVTWVPAVPERGVLRWGASGLLGFQLGCCGRRRRPCPSVRERDGETEPSPLPSEGTHISLHCRTGPSRPQRRSPLAIAVADITAPGIALGLGTSWF